MTPAEAEALAPEALTRWNGRGPARLVTVRENAVFEIALPGAEAGSRRAALRLHRLGYQSEDAIRSELWWMSALADRGQPVPRPVETRDGETVVKLGDGRLASVVTWIEGTPIGAAGRPLAGTAAELRALHAAAGRRLAELHVATDRLALPGWFRRPRWDVSGLVGRSPLWNRFWDHPAATAEERALFLRAREWLGGRLADYAAQGADQGLIHADALRENLLRTAAGLALIDFDDSGFGFRLYDLGVALSQNLAEPALPEIAAGLVEGYDAVRPLGPEDRAILPAMTAMRCLASVGWTLSRVAPEEPGVRRYIRRAALAAEKVMAGGDLFAAPLAVG